MTAQEDRSVHQQAGRQIDKRTRTHAHGRTDIQLEGCLFLLLTYDQKLFIIVIILLLCIRVHCPSRHSHLLPSSYHPSSLLLHTGCLWSHSPPLSFFLPSSSAAAAPPPPPP